MNITQLKDLFNLELTIDDLAPLRESSTVDAVCKFLYIYERQLIETSLVSPDKWEMIKQMRIELENIRKQLSLINDKYNKLASNTWQTPEND